MAETLHSEQFFYIAAIDFADAAAELFKTTEPDRIPDALKELRERFSADCMVKGRNISVLSDNHHIDWSNGTSQADIKDLPVESGDFAGSFRGYADLISTTTRNLGHTVLDLAVVMSSNMWAPNLMHYKDVLIITPIAGSDIRLI